MEEINQQPEQQPEQQTDPQEVKKGNDLKTWSAVVLVSVLIVGGLVWSQREQVTIQEDASTNDDIETSSWKSYRNERLGYEILFPNDWSIRISGSGNSKTLVWYNNFPNSAEAAAMATSSIAFSLDSYGEYPANESWRDYVTRVFPEDAVVSFGGREVILSRDETPISNLVRGSVKFSGSDHNILSVSFHSRPQQSDDLLELVERIVSTISTFDPEALSPDTSDWFVHRVEELGFELRYPQEWTITEISEEDSLKTGSLINIQSDDSNDEEGFPFSETNVTVSYWESINNSYAKGGSWVGEWEYKDLADYFTDKNSLTRKVGEFLIGDARAQEVSLAGHGSAYAVMIERDGVFRIGFSNADVKGSLTDEQRAILESFKFID